MEAFENSSQQLQQHSLVNIVEDDEEDNEDKQQELGQEEEDHTEVRTDPKMEKARAHGEDAEDEHHFHERSSQQQRRSTLSINGLVFEYDWSSDEDDGDDGEDEHS